MCRIDVGEVEQRRAGGRRQVGAVDEQKNQARGQRCRDTAGDAAWRPKPKAKSLQNTNRSPNWKLRCGSPLPNAVDVMRPAFGVRRARHADLRVRDCPGSRG